MLELTIVVFVSLLFFNVSALDVLRLDFPWFLLAWLREEALEELRRVRRLQDKVQKRDSLMISILCSMTR